jgi:outer membrane protein, heavy metal efflux system
MHASLDGRGDSSVGCKEFEVMRVSILVGRFTATALLWGIASTLSAQHVDQAGAAAPASRVSMSDAVRLALERNHELHVQRLNVDLSKADEITAALKPNPVLTSTNENFPVFSPSQMTWDNFFNNQNFVQSVTYLFERGGKRKNRTLVAQDATTVAAHDAVDAERQLAFETQQSFINILLAKSTLQLARENLDNFDNVVEVDRSRLQAGDLAEVDFSRVLLQKLQFEQDLAASEVALVQAKAALRQNVGFDALAEDFDIDGDLSYIKYTVTLDGLKAEALAARPDLLGARTGVTLAEHTEALEASNKARDFTGGLEYDRAGSLNALGFSFSFELPFHDRNQGNIARSKIALRQASEAEAAATSTVLTDVLDAYTTYRTTDKVVSLYQAGYLEQAKESRDISAYVYQHGSGTLLDLLDAERTYRATQLAFRQALAAYMTAVQQINFVVGKQVLQ